MALKAMVRGVVVILSLDGEDRGEGALSGQEPLLAKPVIQEIPRIVPTRLLGAL